MIKVIARPRSVDIEVTSRCNARCAYCYYMNNEGVVYDDLPTQRWLDFFGEMGRAGVMRVCLAGGEPFMRPDLMDLVDGVVRNQMRFSILTNGSLLTRELAVRLRETRRCDYVQVSLDGTTPEVHEAMRGRGSFRPALAAIRILTSEGVSTQVRVTIHSRNIDDLPALAHLLLDELALPSFSTNSVSSLGSRAKYGDGLLLSTPDRRRAMAVLAELDAKYPGRIEAAAGPLADWKMFRRMELARATGKSLPNCGRLLGCGCIFERIAVRADGAFVPCVMLPQIVLGYVGRDSLLEVWRDSAEFARVRARTDIALDTFAECQGCDYVSVCTGNCAGNALSEYGDPNRPSPEACLRRYKRELAEAGLTL